MNRFAILVTLLMIGFSTKAQKGTSISIYFPTDSHQAGKAEMDRLNTFIKDLDCGLCSLTLDGHTDSDGPDNYNQALSERRIESIKNVLAQNFKCTQIDKARALGESMPLNNNKDAIQKAQNRRVEIVFSCDEPQQEVVYQSIWEEFQKIPYNKIEIDCGFNDRDVKVTTDDGIRLIVDANTYGQVSERVNLSFYKVTDYQSAFNHGFTTMTKDKMLETAGMFRVRAHVGNKELEVLKRDGIKIYIPMEENEQSDYLPFASLNENNYVRWQQMFSDSKTSFNPYRTVDDWYIKCGGVRTAKCKFFWCKIRSFFSARFSLRLRSQAANELMKNKDLMNVYELFEDQLKEKFESQKAFALYVIDNDRDEVLKDIKQLVPNFEKLSYYVLNPPNSNWINCDRFSNRDNLISFTVDEAYHPKADIRLFFKGIRSIMPGTSDEKGKIMFNNVPMGRVVTLIIVKKISDVIYLSKETFKIGDKPKVSFKAINSSDLKQVFTTNN